MNSVPSSEVIREAMQYRKNQEALDPVHWYQLTAPDGSQMGDICEMHVSEAARRNESRMASYLASEQRRNDARAAWHERHEEAKRLSLILEHAQEGMAQKAAVAEVPVPASSSSITHKLVASRKTNVPEINVPFFIPEPEPTITYSAADYLWTRTLDVQGRVIRVEGTRRGSHD